LSYFFLCVLEVGWLTVCVSPACFLRGTCVWAGVDSAWEQRNLEASSLSKYDQCSLNPLPNFNVVFGEGVQRTGGASALHLPWGSARVTWRFIRWRVQSIQSLLVAILQSCLLPFYRLSQRRKAVLRCLIKYRKSLFQRVRQQLF
jgi:hypothetical protein